MQNTRIKLRPEERTNGDGLSGIVSTAKHRNKLIITKQAKGIQAHDYIGKTFATEPPSAGKSL